MQFRVGDPVVVLENGTAYLAKVTSVLPAPTRSRGRKQGTSVFDGNLQITSVINGTEREIIADKPTMEKWDEEYGL